MMGMFRGLRLALTRVAWGAALAVLWAGSAPWLIVPTHLGDANGSPVERAWAAYEQAVPKDVGLGAPGFVLWLVAGFIGFQVIFSIGNEGGGK